MIISPFCTSRCTGLFISIALPCAATKLPTDDSVCCAAIISARGSSGFVCAACVASSAFCIPSADCDASTLFAEVSVTVLACAIPAVAVEILPLGSSTPVPCVSIWSCPTGIVDAVVAPPTGNAPVASLSTAILPIEGITTGASSTGAGTVPPSCILRTTPPRAISIAFSSNIFIRACLAGSSSINL